MTTRPEDAEKSDEDEDEEEGSDDDDDDVEDDTASQSSGGSYEEECVKTEMECLAPENKLAVFILGTHACAYVLRSPSRCCCDR